MAVLDVTKDLAWIFKKQVEATPDAVALEDSHVSLTYAALDKKVEALALGLRKHGVVRDSLVGVLMGRSADYVIACLAALRAGGAFLVLELAYPPQLLADVLDDAKPAVVVTHAAHAGRIKEGVTKIVFDEAGAAQHLSVTKEELEKLSPVPSPDDLDRLAFVSYSSGTTGRPKGIANPHSAPVRSYDLRFTLSDTPPGTRVACNVFFVWEILRPLLRGATVVAIPDEVSYDPVRLVELLASHQITETLMTPTLLAAVLNQHEQLGQKLPKLTTLWLNGEVVTTDLASRALKALPHTRLLNCYSASETHEIACGDIGEMIDASLPYCPVGPPMEPEYVYILDEEGNKLDQGASGELCVGGSLLARGYLNLPDTTAKAFSPDKFSITPGARMYRTGDTARVLPSGILEITGRVGAMIKLRGYSVVPSIVENAILAHLAVRSCVVRPHGDGVDKQLVAYVVRDSQGAENRTQLEIDPSGYSPSARRALTSSLAQYMIPALWIEVDVLPTHGVSGKIDFQSLPPPPAIASEDVPAEPNGTVSNGTLEVNMDNIAKFWAASLKVPRHVITTEHDFFDLGGHSLALTDLASRLTKAYDHPVPLTLLAGNPTLQGHIEIVKSAIDGRNAMIAADLTNVLQQDSELSSTIQPKKAHMIPLSAAKSILLTGTTGFLGAFLLYDLWKSTSANIICLVRFRRPSKDDFSAGVARIRKNLMDLGLWTDSILDRMEVVPGNLSQADLGLTSDEFDELASKVDLVIHAAATVNLVYPYAALRNANVRGVSEIIRLASRNGATLHYISTNGVVPPSVDGRGWPESLNVITTQVQKTIPDGYGQTKWVGEQLVREAIVRGLPAKIHRLGTLSGHSKTGAGNAWDLLTAMIVESLQLGFSPGVDGWLAEMTPVDIVSRKILDLAEITDTNEPLFHIGESQPRSMTSIFQDFTNLGYPVQQLPLRDWVKLWHETRSPVGPSEEGSPIGVLRAGMPDISFLQNPLILNDDLTSSLLKEVDRPKVDTSLLATYARHWYARGWLPRQPSNLGQRNGLSVLPTPGPLSGKIAVITGASSGIGAAIAECLAKEGVHLALAARRIDALQTLQTQLESYGSQVMTHKTDVTDIDQVASLMKATAAQLGPIDILVSNAGVMYFTMMANAQTNDWNRMIDVNCKGLVNCLASTVPDMLSRGKGHIVAISSDAGRKVFPGLGVYSGTKFFVEATLQSLRLETAGKGLKVTSIQPGNTETDLLGMSTDQEALEKYGEPSGAKVLDTGDVAKAVVFALKQPAHVAVNEVLIEPRDEPI